MQTVVVVIGAGQIGQAIARRVAVGKQVVLAGRSETNAKAAAEVMTNAGYQVSVATVDVSSREAVLALSTTRRESGKSQGSSTPPVPPPVKRRRIRSCMWISTAPRSCSRSSAKSWPTADPA